MQGDLNRTHQTPIGCAIVYCVPDILPPNTRKVAHMALPKVGFYRYIRKGGTDGVSVALVGTDNRPYRSATS
jgi:hypothetical protein